ncbi:hypothetical protein LEP1GSC096_2328 [Leptospira interrogans serovar Hebdomadis str. R499]|nr:hypothetical protein LEP1GSC045_3489 [Leptospira interrogans serovar Pomona str. Kennewicki LC82-25]EKN95457.1 hypothetical protein LEP1GSC014_0259 [Leptospira interrogans serovar Pomona str. Pomona]EKO68058.1 hypothetical protein LEP1GSC069_1827 [Leptospira interrogans serovar Canicola str. Fiocruz LV133]EKR28149.1 hypothetical protein LEP1GSC087_2349 [Leptospira interrogans serovar Bataviae str. L1111]EKR36223.1 hypothetical protein LEP1GSC096_2328 [Leptospira interrogans serovar Hebdomadi
MKHAINPIFPQKVKHGNSYGLCFTAHFENVGTTTNSNHEK